jgi:AraC-like DNA-binding protein
LILLYHDWDKSKKFTRYTTLYDSLQYKINEIKIKENIKESSVLNEVEKNILAVNHHIKLLEQKDNDLKKLGIMTGVLVIGILFIIMLYRNLQSSYRDLYEKNMRENLTVPCLANLEDKDDKNLELYARVRELFEKEKLYMNPKITLTEIAEKLNTNENYISNAINKFSKTNLTGFINKYRIEEAKKHLAEAAENNYTIDKIAELSGFGNRVTFARVFKTMTNMSPSAFKKMSVS